MYSRKMGGMIFSERDIVRESVDISVYIFFYWRKHKICLPWYVVVVVVNHN